MHPLQEWLTQPRGLSTRLRDLRRDAGLTGRELARRLDWQQSKLSRIETGQQLATADDVRCIAEAVGLDGAQAEVLLAEQGTAQSRAVSLRELQRAGQAPVQAGFVQLASQAVRIRQVDLVAVPGLLQIPEYARAILTKVQAAHRALAGDQDLVDDVDAALEARMLRQQVLYDPAKTFDFLIAEPALRWLICEPAVMRAQLDRLTAAIGLPRVRLGVVPLGVPLRWIPATSSIAVYQAAASPAGDVADAETLGGNVFYRDRDAADISAAVDRLWQDAVTGDGARRLIVAAARDLAET